VTLADILSVESDAQVGWAPARRGSPRRPALLVLLGGLLIATATAMTTILVHPVTTTTPTAPYRIVTSADGRVEARVYQHAGVFTVPARDEVVLTQREGAERKAVSLGCVVDRDNARDTSVAFTTSHSLIVTAYQGSPVPIEFDPSTLRPATRLGPRGSSD
jgi:hypothetical protein